MRKDRTERGDVSNFRRNEVQLWRAALDVDPETLDVLRSLLCADERESSRSFRFERDRVRFTAARGWLRQLLAAYLDADPAELRFDKGVNGKPRLSAAGSAWLRFNVSHSEDVAVYAVSCGHEVGVDIERVRDDLPIESIAQRFFADRELDALRGSPPRLRQRAFFEHWVRKEAYLKAVGLGLDTPLNSVEVLPAASGTVRVLESMPPASRRAWSVHTFDAGAEYAAAVAVEGFEARVPVTAIKAPAIISLWPLRLDRAIGWYV